MHLTITILRPFPTYGYLWKSTYNVVLSVYSTVVLPFKGTMKRKNSLITWVIFSYVKGSRKSWSVLKAHLETPCQRNYTIYSKWDIEIIGRQIIQKSIVNEVFQARFYFIMVDEVTSHIQELMPLCVRFVDVQRGVHIILHRLLCNRSNSCTYM